MEEQLSGNNASVNILNHMGLIDGLKKAISTTGVQITSSPKPQGLYFTPNFYEKAKAWGLSEKDALDMFYHGAEDKRKPGMKTRKYNGYELSIYYGQSRTTGQPYISTILILNEDYCLHLLLLW